MAPVGPMAAHIRRRSLLTAGAALLASSLGRELGAQTPPPGSTLPSALAQPTHSIDLWPKGAPGMPAIAPVEAVTERSANPQLQDRAVQGITSPRLAVFRPEHPNGASVLLFPGGGYQHVVIDREGYEMARWLAARAFTAFVLFYRLPGEGWAAGPDVALADAQRAMRVIRRRAGDYALDPQRVCALGFSAGGHLCADLAARFATPTYAAVDDADALPARPLCAAPIYPVVSMQSGIAHAGSRRLLIGADANATLEAAHSPDRNIPGDAPAHFIVHAEDDHAVPVENSLLLRAALKAKGIAVETHLFREGGHGFGLRNAAGKPVEAWPELWRAWAGSVGLA
ncbi:MAG: hypothetical protein RL684_1052 [Pseudomonadota bacterium]